MRPDHARSKGLREEGAGANSPGGCAVEARVFLRPRTDWKTYPKPGGAHARKNDPANSCSDQQQEDDEDNDAGGIHCDSDVGKVSLRGNLGKKTRLLQKRARDPAWSDLYGGTGPGNKLQNLSNNRMRRGGLFVAIPLRWHQLPCCLQRQGRLGGSQISAGER